ncbi:hypothetical protein BRE01_46360 [Brevibacillus reuszeri]|uniref:Uncharacterized protein n=1 Tax=Brevibacillus reuszeri TaxID=54915 RepID=A0A0K9YZ18_9BACL|nr:hypothetical protein [Brevibacillus reuszeri]KNB73978.1 hypothetical protein ADS79_08645 [Brevibacillus reuszeri]MED1859860.1 hypothetical protein [Brevibacillus reuszeri]GED70934.1 hypothetical protein BRE01_46360 [Brevibacillus reuszeri]
MGLFYWRVIADDGKGGVTKSSEGTFIIYVTGVNLIIGRDGQGQVTYTFRPSNIIEQWTIPIGCERVQINAKEAKGGNGWFATNYTQGIGGKGGSVSWDIPLTPGKILKIVVGRKGQDYQAGFGGGGASYVIRTGNVPLVVSAGGGASNASRHLNARIL